MKKITSNVTIYEDEVDLKTYDGYINITKDGTVTVKGEYYREGWDDFGYTISQVDSKLELITFLKESLVLLENDE